MVALDYYGFSFDPFDKNIMVDRQSFQSRDHQRAMEAVQDTVSRNGFSMIRARSNLGKSRRFLDSLDASYHIAAYLAPGFATTPEFYRMLCIQFKLDPTGNKQWMLNTVKHYLHSCYLRNKPAVIVVDEA